MLDRCGKELKVGDCIRFSPNPAHDTFDEISFIYKIYTQRSMKDAAIFKYKDVLYARNSCEIEKITNEEALIWKLER